jgi:hypothetical protein
MSKIFDFMADHKELTKSFEKIVESAVDLKTAEEAEYKLIDLCKAYKLAHPGLTHIQYAGYSNTPMYERERKYSDDTKEYELTDTLHLVKPFVLVIAAPGLESLVQLVSRRTLPQEKDAVLHVVQSN